MISRFALLVLIGLTYMVIAKVAGAPQWAATLFGILCANQYAESIVLPRQSGAQP